MPLQAAAEKAELLVLGSSGLGPLTGYLIGSVALATVGPAMCPVVLVRAGTGAPDGVATTDGDSPERATDTDVVLGLDEVCDPLLEFAFEAAAHRPGSIPRAWDIASRSARTTRSKASASATSCDRSSGTISSPTVSRHRGSSASTRRTWWACTACNTASTEVPRSRSRMPGRAPLGYGNGGSFA